jgi:diguanylate cyclase (GGDEF)-like protein
VPSEVAGLTMWKAAVDTVSIRLTRDMYRQYRQYYLAADIRQMTIGLAVIGLVVAVFSFSDYLLFGYTPQFYSLLTLRLILLAATAAVILLLSKAVVRPAAYDLVVLAYGICAVSICIYIGWTRPDSYMQYTALDVAIVAAIYLFFTCRRLIKTALALLLTAGDLIIVVVLKENAGPLVWNVTLTSYILVNFLGILFALRIEAFRRRRFLDVIDEDNMRSELVRMASVDELTGIWNRRKFLDLAEKEAERYVRYIRPYSLMMIDLDYFKTVNDRFGHVSGDTALKQFAGIVSGQIRSTDIFGRLGGEEFGIILPETGLAEAMVLGERICKALHSTDINVLDGCAVRVTASIGLAEACAAHSTLDDVISAADTALYRAKDRGRNCIEVAESEVSQASLDM